MPTDVVPYAIEYLKTPSSLAMLILLVERAELTLCQLLRKTGTPYAELGLADEALGEGRWSTR